MSSSWGSSWGKSFGRAWGTPPAQAAVSGVTLDSIAALIAGTASGAAAAAPSALLGVTLTLVPGAAAGAAATVGITLTAGTELLPGMSTGAGATPGIVLSSGAELRPGMARGQTGEPEVPDVGWRFGGLSVPINRQKKASRPGRAMGATFDINAVLIAGTASGAGAAAGPVLHEPATLTYWYARDWTEEHRAELAREEDELLQLLGILPITVAGQTVFLEPM